ncbi:MAG TPA: Fe-S cluster assembly protein SufD [Ruminococcaceae bacterium]|nr:Fe-S cluster assembly protein SufD [Oscillospiraceae bacterium]
MDLALKEINRLPVPTWNLLGINSADINGVPAVTAPYKGEYLSELPEGVSISDKTVYAPEIDTGMGADAQKFSENNKNCGATLRVKAGVKADKPVFLRYRIDGKNSSVVDVTCIVAEEGSEVTVVENYSSEGGAKGFHGGLTKIYAAKDAAVNLVQVQMLGDGCTHFDNVGGAAEENAVVNILQAQLGAGEAYAGCKVKLLGTGSRLNVDTIYFGDKKRKIDINYVAEHTGRKTRCDINVNGALMDESSKTFRGTINFLKGAKKAVGHESEYNLLFSRKVRSRTAPLILCSEEDVDGQHAAATGKIDPDRLFYLMSRGLSETDAKKLIIKAQFQPAVEKIPDPSIRDAVFDYVKERLDSVESIS